MAKHSITVKCNTTEALRIMLELYDDIKALDALAPECHAKDRIRSRMAEKYRRFRELVETERECGGLNG